MKKIYYLAEKYIPQLVYGATDGTITTFSIVAGVVGANLSSAVILLLGISNVISDGFSMASSNYLSIRSDKQSNIDPWKASLATFLAFVVVGTIPITPFIFGIWYETTDIFQFKLSIVATAIAFIVSGMIRGKMTNENIYKTALETVVIGGIAAYIAYIIGYFLKNLI